MSGRYPAGLLAALAVAAPVLVGVGYSALAALGVVGIGSSGEASAARLARVLGEGAVWAGVGWSLWVATAATLLAGGAAVLVAALFRGTGRLHRAARLLAVLPLPVPHLVAAALGVLILAQSGLLARLGHALGWISAPADAPALVQDPWGVGLILALAWKEAPFLALIAFSVLADRVAPLEETARSLGAGAWETFRRVTLPLLWRGMMPGVVAVWIFAVGSYEAAVLLAPSDPLALPLLTMERYTDASLARRGDAFVLALVALAIGGVAVAAHERLRAGWEGLRG